MREKNKSWCEKYRVKSFSGLKGQDFTIKKVKDFFNNFSEKKTKKALILYGTSGTGKTSLAYALADFANREIFEINASDLRNRDKINNILRPAIEQKSLFFRGKIILIDEIDTITRDYGGLPEIISLITRTGYPIIITANDIWDKKFNLLRQKSELIKVTDIKYTVVRAVLREICEKEKLKVDYDLLTSIAVKSKGDIRAAINDLQSVASTELVQSDMVVSERDKEEGIFNILRTLFKNKATNAMLGLFDSSDMPLNEIFLWIEENIPREYSGRELYEACEALSIADVFRGRIIRQQHWRFLVYQNALLSFGVSSAKKTQKSGFTTYKRPTRILKIWLSNQKNLSKKSIATKYAKATHCSKKRALKEFFLLPLIINEKIRKELKLEEHESDFLNEKTEIAKRN